MQVRINKIPATQLLGRKLKEAHCMRMNGDLFLREHMRDGHIRWSIYNKGMYDWQNEENSARLEAKFQAHKPRETDLPLL